MIILFIVFLFKKSRLPKWQPAPLVHKTNRLIYHYATDLCRYEAGSYYL